MDLLNGTSANPLKLDNIKLDSKPKNMNLKGFVESRKEAFDEVNKEQKTSEQALADVASGQIKDLHQAAIAIGRAEMSMKTMLEVRNKAINAYKEILRTQV